MEMSQLEMSQLELVALDPEDFKWTRLSDFYLTRLLKKANELGLEGKRIKEIIGIEEQFGTFARHIDFICEK